jgi:hypothetical protein
MINTTNPQKSPKRHGISDDLWLGDTDNSCSARSAFSLLVYSTDRAYLSNACMHSIPWLSVPKPDIQPLQFQHNSHDCRPEHRDKTGQAQTSCLYLKGTATVSGLPSLTGVSNSNGSVLLPTRTWHQPGNRSSSYTLFPVNSLGTG